MNDDDEIPTLRMAKGPMPDEDEGGQEITVCAICGLPVYQHTVGAIKRCRRRLNRQEGLTTRRK